MVFGIPLDYMHACLLGVTRHVWNLIMKSNVGSYRKTIEERLLSIRFPSTFSRQPRKLEEEANFKASEWEHIALYCFYPCLSGFLTENMLNHFMLFSSSLFLLLEYKISDENLEKCERKLKKFCSEFGSIYGQASETFNVHLVTHLVETVRHVGGLWNSSLFPYENGNGILLKYRTGNNKPVVQIAKKYALRKTCNYIPIPENSPIRNWVNEIWQGKTTPKLIFSEHLLYCIENEELEEGIVSREFSYHSKFFYRGLQFCTKGYCEDLKYDDSFIKLNQHFYQITSILTDRQNKIYIVGRVLIVNRLFENLYIYKKSRQKKIIKLNETIRLCINVEIEVDYEKLNFISVVKYMTQVE